jgi:CheY-like chemotaxis protein
MDVGMPKMNGLDATRHIRQQPWGKAITIIALTGWGQDDDRRRTEEAGFNGHLVKPARYDALMQLLAELRPSGLTG